MTDKTQDPCGSDSSNELGKPSPVEVRLNEDGTLDEVVGHGFFHMEQMDDNHWWLRIEDSNGDAVVVNLVARGKIKAHHDRELRQAEAEDPKCDRCGAPITTGMMVLMCPHGRQCAFVDDDDHWHTVEELRADFGIERVKQPNHEITGPKGSGG